MTESARAEIYDCGWNSLAFAVVEQAVSDVKQLQQSGVLKGLRCTLTDDTWPKRKDNQRAAFIGDYDNSAAVCELIYFFKGGVADLWLGNLQTRLDAASIAHALEANTTHRRV